MKEISVQADQVKKKADSFLESKNMLQLLKNDSSENRESFQSN